MFEYPFEKYHYYVGKNKVVALSTYEGRTVRGIAKCDPKDKFDVEAGMKLAAARCNRKIAQKRFHRASVELRKSEDAMAQAAQRNKDMRLYFEDAAAALDKAILTLRDTLDVM